MGNTLTGPDASATVGSATGSFNTALRPSRDVQELHPTLPCDGAEAGANGDQCSS